MQSTPPTGLSIGSSTGQGGTTNYTKAGVGYGTNVNLQAPAADPKGYTFSQWTVNGAAQSCRPEVRHVHDGWRDDGRRAVHAERLRADRGIHAADGAGDRFEHGPERDDELLLNKSVADGTSVNLQAPATDPAGYTFSQWTSTARRRRRAEVRHVHDGRGHDGGGGVHANGYTLTLQSTPPTGMSIGFEHGALRDDELRDRRRRDGTSVNVVAPAPTRPDTPSRNGR